MVHVERSALTINAALLHLLLAFLAVLLDVPHFTPVILHGILRVSGYGAIRRRGRHLSCRSHPH